VISPKRHDANARKTHELEKGGDMLLVAADAIERLDEHDVELAFPRPVEKFLITRAEIACARHAAIGIDRLDIIVSPAVRRQAIGDILGASGTEALAHR
jgi:hypothetical protein